MSLLYFRDALISILFRAKDFREASRFGGRVARHLLADYCHYARYRRFMDARAFTRQAFDWLRH